MIPYTLIRSSRRSLSLQVNEQGALIVRSPQKLSLERIEMFIREKESWIKKHASRRTLSGPKKQYTKNEIHTMKQELLDFITIRTVSFWKDSGLPKYTGIKITKSEKRWGSCSSKNSLCFSYRLWEYLPTNQDFVDAIIVHELAHLREKNHQKPFWDLVYSMMPEYEETIKSEKQTP